jgi:methanesulfonate monooxygenase subunit alpha
MGRTAEAWQSPPEIPGEDYISNAIYTDPDLFKEELEAVKKRTWKFACHESEIPNVNDFRRVNHAGVPLIVVRSDDGNIRSFINACSHRAALVVRELSGNARNWTCLFHHWCFDTRGNCLHIPRDEAYDKVGLCKEKLGLRVVRTQTRLGMVFVNLDDGAPPLDDYLGDALENLVPVMGDPERPLEVFHYSKTIVRANWKQWHETNMDPYHEYLHYVNRRVAMKGDGYYDRVWKIYSGAHATLSPMRQRYEAVKGWTSRNTMPMPGMMPDEFRTVKIFPDTNVLVRATVMRIDTSSPISPNETLVEWRGLGVKGESAEDRAMRTQHHNQFWGPFGRNLYEDAYAIECVNEANRGGGGTYSILARHEDMRTQDDGLLRAYYQEWGRLMGRPAHDPKRRLSNSLGASGL